MQFIAQVLVTIQGFPVLIEAVCSLEQACLCPDHGYTTLFIDITWIYLNKYTILSVVLQRVYNRKKKFFKN